MEGEVRNMKTEIQLQTMALSYQEICAGKNPWIPLGMFMHDFFGNFVGRREELVKDAIKVQADVTPLLHQWAVFCAASVEYLCQKYGLPCPDWVHNPEYTLSEPWYYSPGAHKPHIRKRLEEETPEPFTRRNIYCGDHVWANKYEMATAFEQRQSA
jgi:hypothetical protein